MAGVKITDEDLDTVKYAVKGLLQEIRSNSIDMSYIMNKVNVIISIAERITVRQYVHNKNKGN